MKTYILISEAMSSFLCHLGIHTWQDNQCKKCGKSRYPVSKPVKSDEEIFIEKALKNGAYCRIPIRQLGSTSSSLAREFMKTGISSNDIPDFFGNSLLAICPVCHDYISGNALLMLDLFSSSANVIFTGNSGGAERLAEGKCKSYSCYAQTYDLYWCPDLDPKLLNDIRIRHGINIDSAIQHKRDHLWKPR